MVCLLHQSNSAGATAIVLRWSNPGSRVPITVHARQTGHASVSSDHLRPEIYHSGTKRTIVGVTRVLPESKLVG